MTLLEPPLAPPTERDWSPSDVRRVVIRLEDGDELQVGTAPTLDSANVLARTVITELEGPTAEWPLIGNRLIRPDAITSVDVVSIDHHFRH
jgi:hypothetical protein